MRRECVYSGSFVDGTQSAIQIHERRWMSEVLYLVMTSSLLERLVITTSPGREKSPNWMRSEEDTSLDTTTAKADECRLSGFFLQRRTCWSRNKAPHLQLLQWHWISWQWISFSWFHASSARWAETLRKSSWAKMQRRGEGRSRGTNRSDSILKCFETPVARCHEWIYPKKSILKIHCWVASTSEHVCRVPRRIEKTYALSFC